MKWLYLKVIVGGGIVSLMMESEAIRSEWIVNALSMSSATIGESSECRPSFDDVGH